MTTTPRIYVASRASISGRAEMWKELRDEKGWNIISTWIDESGPGQTECMTELWQRITTEVSSCDSLILYFGQNDRLLKGALVEAGMALSLGKHVFVVFEERAEMKAILGSWLAHPNVIVSASLFLAHAKAKQLYSTQRREQ